MKKFQAFLVKHEAALVLVGCALVLLAADAASAQGTVTTQATTFDTGFGNGVNSLLSKVVRGAQVIGLGGGMIHGIRNGMAWAKGDRDAADGAKGVIIGLAITAGSVGIGQVIISTMAG